MLFDLIVDIFISMGSMFFIRSALISSILFSFVVLGSDFYSSFFF